jgi:hypothetical protein
VVACSSSRATIHGWVSGSVFSRPRGRASRLWGICHPDHRVRQRRGECLRDARPIRQRKAEAREAQK